MAKRKPDFSNVVSGSSSSADPKSAAFRLGEQAVENAQSRKAPPVTAGTTSGIENPLARRFRRAAESGGGIQPGAHPELNRPSPIERAGNAVKRVIERLNSSGSKRSPSTKRDR